jgi:hypothetical protein
MKQNTSGSTYQHACIATDYCSCVRDPLNANAVPINLPYILEIHPTFYIPNLPRYPRLTFYINFLRTLYPTICYTRCLNRRFFLANSCVCIIRKFDSKQNVQ